MAVTRDRLVIEIEAQAKGVEKSFKKAENSVKQFTKSVDDTNSKLAGFQKSTDKTAKEAEKLSEFERAFQRNNELLERNIRQLNKALEVQRVSLEMHEASAMAANRLALEQESLGQSVKTVNSSFDEQIKSLQDITSKIDVFIRRGQNIVVVAAGFARLVEVVTDPEFLRRLSRLLKIISLIARIKFGAGAARFVKALAKAIEDLANRFERLRKVIKIVNVSLLQQNKLMEEATIGFTDVASAVKGTVQFLSDVKDLFQALTDPAFLDQMAKLLQIFAAIARIKFGKDVSDFLLDASDKTESLARRFERLEGANPFDEISKKAVLFNNVVQALDTTFNAVILGTGIFTFLQLTGQIDNVRAGLGNIRKSVGALSRDFTNAGTLLKNTYIPGLVGVTVETANIAKGLVILGATLRQSNNEFTTIAGTIIFVTGIVFGAFSFAIFQAVTSISRLAAAIGDDLINAMLSFEKEAKKFEQTIFNFRNTIIGFNQVMGEQAVGSLEMWEKALIDAERTTTFSQQSIAKSIKLIVAEGVRIGLSPAQGLQLLKTGLDQASASGKDLEDVTQRLIGALTGNAQAALALGLDIRESALAHSELGEALGGNISKLDEHEKTQLRFNEIVKQSLPILGAAERQTETLAGAEAVLEKKVQDVRIALGETGAVTRNFIRLQQRMLEIFLDLPKPIIDIVGAAQDFLGVFLKIGGTVGSVLFAFSALISGITFLNGLLATNATIQALVTQAFTVMGTAVGVTTVKVTGLAAAVTNLNRIFITGLLVSLKSLASAFVLLSQRLAVFLVAIAPLVIKIGLIVSAVVALFQAFQELSDDLSLLKSSSEDAAGGVEMASAALFDMEAAIETASSAIRAFMRVIISITKIAIGGFVAGFLLLQRQIIRFKILAASTRDELNRLRKSLKENEEAQKQLRNVIGASLEEIGRFGVKQAQASEETKKSSEELDKHAKAAERFKAAMEAALDIDVRALEIDVLGDQFEASMNRFLSLNQQLNQTMDRIAQAGKASEEELNKLADLKEQRERARLEVVKLRANTLKSALETEKALQREALQLAGEQRALIESENQQRLAAAQAALANAAKIAPLRGEEIKKAKELIKNIKAANAARLKEFDTQAAKKFQDQLDNILGKEQELAISAAKLANDNLKALQLEEKARTDAFIARVNQFKATNQLTNEQIAQLDALIAKEKELSATKLAVAAKKQFEAEDKAAAEAAGPGIGASIAAGIGEGVAIAAEGFAFIADLFSPDNIKGLGLTFGETMSQLPLQIVDAIGNLGPAIQSFIDKFPEALTKALDMLPAALASAFEKLPDLVNVLVDGFLAIVDRLPEILQVFVDGLIEGFVALVERIPEILLKVFEQLGPIVAILIRGIIKAFIAILENLPAIVQSLITGLLSAVGDIVGALIDELIAKGGIFKIARALVVAILELIPAILKGIRDGLVGLFQGILGGFDISEMASEFTESVEEGVNEVFSAVTGASSELFRVAALTTGERAAAAEDRIRKALTSATTQSVERVTGLWERFLNLLDEIWTGLINFLLEVWRVIESIALGLWETLVMIWDQIIKPIWDGMMGILQEVWNAIEAIAMGLWESLKLIWEQVIAPLWDGFMNILSEVWGAIEDIVLGLWDSLVMVWEQIIKPLWDGLINILVTAFDEIVKVGGEIWDGLVAAAGDIFQFFMDLGAMIWEGLESGISAAGDLLFDLGGDVWDGLVFSISTAGDLFRNLGKDIWEGFKSVFDVDLLPGLGGGGGGNGDGGGGFFGGIADLFQTGGFVGPEGGIAEPGEFVVQQSAAAALGPGILNQINQGQVPATGGDVKIDSIEIKLDTEQVDEFFIRNSLVPIMEDELRKRSLEGRRVLATTGVR